MLQSNGKSILALDGINQQDFEKIQLVSGAFPYQIGLQQRFPGKHIDRVFLSSVGSIFPFYNVYGRPYTMYELNGSFEIVETPVPFITIAARAPTTNTWFDDFSGYILGSIQRLWGAGIWSGGVGVCETIIEGVIDPFLVYATIAAADASINYAPQTVSSAGATPIGQDTGTHYQFPKNPPDISLKHTHAVADNSCTGQGTEDIDVDDAVKLYNQPGDFTGTVISANDLTVGQIANFYGIRVGRIPNVEIPGYVQGTCPGPAQPTPTIYFYNLNNGEFGIES